MPLPPPTALLPLVLLATLPAAAELPECTEATLRVELHAEPPVRLPVVCLSAGQETSFRLDTPLRPQGVELTGARTLEWGASSTGLALFAPADLVAGERFTLRLLFAGPDAPESVTFELVAHPARVTRQVQVFRHPRTLADYQRESREARAEAQQCRADKARLEVVCRAHEGLLGQLTANAIGLRDFRAGPIDAVLLGKRNARPHAGTVGYRVGTEVLLVVRLENPGLEPWTVAGAALLGPSGNELPLRPLQQAAPIAPGEEGEVRVGAVLPDKSALGPYTLKLWDAAGKRTVTLGNIVFP